MVLVIAKDFAGVWYACELFDRDRKFDELFVIHRTSDYNSCVANFCVSVLLNNGLFGFWQPFFHCLAPTLF